MEVVARFNNEEHQLDQIVNIQRAFGGAETLQELDYFVVAALFTKRIKGLDYENHLVKSLGMFCKFVKLFFSV
jgi:hypothetical protein